VKSTATERRARKQRGEHGNSVERTYLTVCPGAPSSYEQLDVDFGRGTLTDTVAPCTEACRAHSRQKNRRKCKCKRRKRARLESSQYVAQRVQTCFHPARARRTEPQHNTTQHNTTQHNTTRPNTTRHDTIQHVTTQHNTTRHDTIQDNTTRDPTEGKSLCAVRQTLRGWEKEETCCDSSAQGHRPGSHSPA
jgi:hypothetical protein